MKSNSSFSKRMMQRMRERKIPAVLRNRYVLSSAAFLFWMLFFDGNDVMQQVRMRYQIHEQNRKIKYYQTEIAKVNAERDALFGNAASLERFARERYRMTKDGEDLYLIVKQ